MDNSLYTLVMKQSAQNQRLTYKLQALPAHSRHLLCSNQYKSFISQPCASFSDVLTCALEVAWMVNLGITTLLCLPRQTF